MSSKVKGMREVSQKYTATWDGQTLVLSTPYTEYVCDDPQIAEIIKHLYVDDTDLGREVYEEFDNLFILRYDCNYFWDIMNKDDEDNASDPVMTLEPHEVNLCYEAIFGGDE